MKQKHFCRKKKEMLTNMNGFVLFIKDFDRESKRFSFL